MTAFSIIVVASLTLPILFRHHAQITKVKCANCGQVVRLKGSYTYIGYAGADYCARCAVLFVMPSLHRAEDHLRRN